MVMIPNIDTTLNRINTIQLDEKEDTLKVIQQVLDVLEEKTNDNNQRGYLGGSSIGDPCERKLWYGFHFASPKENFTEKTKRIFNMGHIAEAFIIKDLEKVGIKVTDAQKAINDVAGHYGGHIDGVGIGVIEAPKTPHLLEFKTHNQKSFDSLTKQAVKKAKPLHFAQMQTYMHYLKLSRALYVAYNKNTSEYYLERVEYNKSFAEDLTRKAERIIIAEEPPIKAFAKTWFECKWCNHKDICHNGQEPESNCRTCSHVDICDGGNWECGLTNKTLTISQQKAGCSSYQKGWGL